MSYSIEPLCEEDVRVMLGWRYAPPYDVYDLAGADDASTVAALLDPAQNYFAVRTGDGDLVGFCCFGADARVPGWDYAGGALDVGIGMRPDLTGQGRGYAFVAAVMAYGLRRFPHAQVRATIAVFNERSQRVFLRHGLREIGRFARSGAPPLAFVVMAGAAEASGSAPPL